ncbi:uncharacterized protein BN620_01811 [Sutterella sp. CAG:351]|nr:uncharacterized protein BN620_01811 [Sutterella sp. CAG:351]
MKRFVRADHDRAGIDFFHRADRFAGVFRRRDSRDMGNPAVDKIFRRAAVKGLRRVRRERETDIPHAFLRVFGVGIEECIQFLPIERRDVLHVVHILQPPLNLETPDTGRDKFREVPALIVVFKREQVLVARENRAVLKRGVKGQAADLGAGAAVRAPALHSFARVALAAVTHAERPVHKELNPGRSEDIRDRADFF